ncbi:MAG: aminotransferase class I/II-fold pyridoxal phosphate-dependent enzyme [Syntrophomonadaceae bacterium]
MKGSYQRWKERPSSLRDAINTVTDIEKIIAPQFRVFEDNAYINSERVLQAFQEARVREHHFYGSTGYGYGDAGRTALERLYALVFQAEDALVRPQIVSGTHAISACLFALLKPGDGLLSITGRPYDTLFNIIGGGPERKGTLAAKGVLYKEIPLDQAGLPDVKAIAEAVDNNTKMVLIQRSRGYSLRPAIPIESIKGLIKLVKQQKPDCIVLVDNCYGEFVEQQEPCRVGADLVAGSLIKNPGGGLAPNGGYIAGQARLIETIAYHITAPGLGKQLGSSLVDKRWFFQGLFMAPHTVLQALKGAALIAALFEHAGYRVEPKWNEFRADIIQSICFNTIDELQHFCQVVQNCSPVDSDVRLEFARLPGYDVPVIMAAGTFVQGASIELSCDAPAREPYCAYLQGGLTYEHCRYLAAQLIRTLGLQV